MKESLKEMVEVASYCVNFEKSDDTRWVGHMGCYGYPGALLLLSIVDALGSEIIGGGDDCKKHFKILNHKNYYNLKLKDDIIEKLRNEYRNYLSHNAQIGNFVAMYPGDEDSSLLENKDGFLTLNLKPFLAISENVVSDFLNKN